MFAFKVWWENEERRLRNKGVNDEQLEAMRKIAWQAWMCAVNIALKAVKNTMDENQWALDNAVEFELDDKLHMSMSIMLGFCYDKIEMLKDENDD